MGMHTPIQTTLKAFVKRNSCVAITLCAKTSYNNQQEEADINYIHENPVKRGYVDTQGLIY